MLLLGSSRPIAPSSSFEPLIESRKAQNLASNDAVSVVIGWGSATVQLEGTARLLSKTEGDAYAEELRSKGEPDDCYFSITPTWLRYTDLKATPWDVTELDL